MLSSICTSIASIAAVAAATAASAPTTAASAADTPIRAAASLASAEATAASAPSAFDRSISSCRSDATLLPASAFRAGELALRGIKGRFLLRQNRLCRAHFGLTLLDRQPGVLNRDLGTAQFRLCLVAVGFQLTRVKRGQRLPRLDELALSHQDRFNPSGKLRGHINLDRFDAPVAARKPLGNRAVAVALPDQEPQYSRGHDNRCEEKVSGVCHVVLDCCYGRIL